MVISIAPSQSNNQYLLNVLNIEEMLPIIHQITEIQSVLDGVHVIRVIMINSKARQPSADIAVPTSTHVPQQESHYSPELREWIDKPISTFQSDIYYSGGNISALPLHNTQKQTQTLVGERHWGDTSHTPHTQNIHHMHHRDHVGVSNQIEKESVGVTSSIRRINPQEDPDQSRDKKWFQNWTWKWACVFIGLFVVLSITAGGIIFGVYTRLHSRVVVQEKHLSNVTPRHENAKHPTHGDVLGLNHQEDYRRGGPSTRKMHFKGVYA